VSPAWLAAEGVDFAYPGRPVLRGVRFAVPEEEPVLVVVGPSGAGKSTLLKLLAGHLRPDAGRLSFFGAPIAGPSALRPVVFQDYNLFPWKTVLDNVTFGLKCAGVPAAERRRRGREALARLRLSGTEPLYPAELSGGMQQRVGLARALAVAPRSILMDEPLSALDDDIKLELCCEITRLVAEEGTRFVIVTHDLAAAAFLGDRALLLPGRGEAREVPLPRQPHPRRGEDLDAPGSLARRRELRDRLAARP
jgi:ABC-type nitrate/sulfonate/bicarbonate transport system ATPase subunit